MLGASIWLYTLCVRTNGLQRDRPIVRHSSGGSRARSCSTGASSHQHGQFVCERGGQTAVLHAVAGRVCGGGGYFCRPRRLWCDILTPHLNVTRVRPPPRPPRRNLWKFVVCFRSTRTPSPRGS